MANFNKSKGFNLKSGNGPLAFKQMGSSPAKQSSIFGLVSGLTTKKESELDLKSSNLQEATVKGVSRKATEGPGGDGIEKMARIGDVKKDSGPKKPSKSFGEVSTETKIKKAAADKEDTVFNDAKDDGTVVSRGAKKAGSWVKRMADKSQKFRNSAEGQRFQDTMNKIAGNINPKGNYSTDNEARFKEDNRAQEIHSVKMENVERDQLEQDQMNRVRGEKIKAFDEVKKMKLNTSKKFSEKGGKRVFTPQSELRKNQKPLGTDINQY